MACIDSPISIYKRKNKHGRKRFASKPCAIHNQLAAHGTNDVFVTIHTQIRAVKKER